MPAPVDDRGSFDILSNVIGCPIRASLGALGHKWGLLVLRDVAFCRDTRFSDLLRNIDGLTPRVLSFRLRELQEEGLIRKEKRGEEEAYELTEKGMDAIPILTALTRFGVRHRASEVFRDGRPRTLEEILPQEPVEVLGATATLAVTGRYVRVRPKGRLPPSARQRVPSKTRGPANG